MSDSNVASSAPGRAFMIALWVGQILLAVAFVAAGAMKLVQSIDVLAATMGWPGDIPSGVVRFIGLAELAGGLGVVLPAVTRIRPHLTPLAAVGLAIVMALAAAFHLSRGEVGEITPTLILGLLAAFVAWGRGRAAPIAPRAVR